MTTERRKIISAEDIRSIEVECNNCRVRTNYPISGDKAVQPKCPHCGKEWLSSAPADLDNAIRNLRKALRQSVQDQGKDVGMKLSIELQPDAD